MTGSLPRIDLVNLSHIGVVVRSAERTIEFLSSIWRIGPQDIVDYAPAKKDLLQGDPFRVRIASIKFGPLFIELLQPMDERSIWAEFIQQHGEGIHHIALGVTNYDELVSVLEQQGHRMLVAARFRGERWCYFATSPGGLVIELREEYS